jgi:hypothetical protein
VFQVSPRGDEAYVLTTEGRFYVMDLPSGRVSRQLDLFALEPSLRGLQLYGHDAWDGHGRFYFAAFGRPWAWFDARLVAIDPARLLAAVPRGPQRGADGHGTQPALRPAGPLGGS